MSICIPNECASFQWESQKINDEGHKLFLLTYTKANFGSHNVFFNRFFETPTPL